MQYYFRMISSFKYGNSNKKEKPSYEDNKLEFIKNPVITEFLGLPNPKEFHENDLEKSIISHLQTFMMEFGCKKCGDIIEIKTVNDLKRCSCGAVAVDGGKDYLKRIGNKEKYEELSAFCTNSPQSTK